MAFGNATKGYVKAHSGGGGGGGSSNYNDLSNKPSINGVTLSGNKTSEELGISGGGGITLTDITANITANLTDISQYPLLLITCSATISNSVFRNSILIKGTDINDQMVSSIQLTESNDISIIF